MLYAPKFSGSMKKGSCTESWSCLSFRTWVMEKPKETERLSMSAMCVAKVDTARLRVRSLPKTSWRRWPSSVGQKICQSTCGSRNFCVAWEWSLGHAVLWKKPVDIVVLFLPDLESCFSCPEKQETDSEARFKTEAQRKGSLAQALCHERSCQAKKCTERDIVKAHNHLKEQAWLWKPETCACGGSWIRASYKESQHRGWGRLFWRCSDCRRFSDVMDHSLLPPVHMPLPHIDEAVTLYFQGSTAPTLEAMASNLGHNGQSKPSLQKIRSALLTFEAEAAKKRQHKRKLRGIVEADATSLRKMKLPKTTTLRYFQAFGVASRDSREVQLYDLG